MFESSWKITVMERLSFVDWVVAVLRWSPMVEVFIGDKHLVDWFLLELGMGGIHLWGTHPSLWQNKPALPGKSWINYSLNLLLLCQVSHNRCTGLEFYPDTSLMLSPPQNFGKLPAGINKGGGGIVLLRERFPINFFLPSTLLFYCILSLRLWKWTFEWLIAGCSGRAVGGVLIAIPEPVRCPAGQWLSMAPSSCWWWL